MIETPENCLLQAVESLGGFKLAGHKLRPELSPVDAGKWLARCLNDDHAQRLNYAQVALVFRAACERGHHDGFRAYAEAVGYRIEPLDRTAEIVALTSRAEEHAAKAGELTAEVKALMAAAGLNVEVVS